MATTSPGILGTGHPNKILSCDYGTPVPSWTFTVETFVALDKPLVDKIKSALSGKDPIKIKEIVKDLIKAVPPGEDPEAAKKMIAAAFGLDYPFADTSPATSLGASRQDREVRPPS